MSRKRDQSPEADPRAGSGHRRWSRRKRLFVLLAVNCVLLLLVLLAVEIGVRWYREGSLALGLASMTQERPVPRDLGVNDWLVPDPERGYRLNAELDRVNDLGVRHGPIGPGKGEGEYRILVIGDSVSWDVPGFVSLLRDALAARSEAAYTVVNASVPGYTSWQERLTLLDLLPEIAPDLVIVQYCLNDNHRFLHQLDEGGAMLITQEARRALLPDGDGPIDRLLRWSYLAIEIRRKLYAPDEGATEYPWQARHDFGPAWQDRTWPAVADDYRAMTEAARAAGARLTVVAVPYEPQLDRKLLDRDRDYVLRPQRELASLCADLSVPLLDLHPIFLARGGEKLFRDRVHFTDAGQALTAAALLEHLERQGLLTPR